MTLLHLQNISGGYGGAPILHDIEMKVGKTDIVVIAGPNGAGKSTAMKSVFGMLVIEAGTICFNGQDITHLKTEHIVKRGIGYVPQVDNVFKNLTVEENLEMGAYLRNGAFTKTLTQVYALFPDLKKKRHQPAGTLSGGQRQMVAMGRALMAEPVLLLLDEPTAGLSPKYMEQIFSIIKDINATGTAILMVEQHAKQALKLADNGYILVTGRNKFDGPGQELIADPVVQKMFLGGAET